MITDSAGWVKLYILNLPDSYDLAVSAGAGHTSLDFLEALGHTFVFGVLQFHIVREKCCGSEQYD